jgi:hypothetical protein
MRVTRSRGSAISLILGFCLALQPLALAQEASPTGNSRLFGKIIGTDGKPLPGARVLAYHLSSEDVFTSEPTDSGGQYEIDQLPYGYYDLAVETADGLYVANQVVNVAPSGKASISLELKTLVQASAAGEAQARLFPGAEQDPSGVAAVSEKLTGREFWKSAKGVAIIAGGGAALLLLIASSDSDTTSSSPSNP